VKAGDKILLVDDNSDFRSILNSALTDKGFVIGEAGDGQEALEIVQREQFAMAIVDLDMPRMDGLEFTRRAKALIPKFPVIMITAYAQFHSPGEILSAGVDAFLQKPVDLAMLQRAIDSL
jgi:CheY-like chemotaxis protein